MIWLAVARRSLHHVNVGFYLALGPVVKNSRELENHHIHGQLHVCSFSDALISNSEKRKSTEIFVTNGSLAVLKSFRLQRGQRKTVSTITASDIKSCHKHLQKHKTAGNSLGPGSAVKEEGRKKGGQIGKYRRAMQAEGWIGEGEIGDFSFFFPNSEPCPRLTGNNNSISREDKGNREGIPHTHPIP